MPSRIERRLDRTAAALLDAPRPDHLTGPPLHLACLSPLGPPRTAAATAPPGTAQLDPEALLRTLARALRARGRAALPSTPLAEPAPFDAVAITVTGTAPPMAAEPALDAALRSGTPVGPVESMTGARPFRRTLAAHADGSVRAAMRFIHEPGPHQPPATPDRRAPVPAALVELARAVHQATRPQRSPAPGRRRR